MATNAGEGMVTRIFITLVFCLFISACGGDAKTTAGDSVGGPGVIVNKYDLNGNTMGTIEDGNPDDSFSFNGNFYKTRSNRQQSIPTATTAMARQCVTPYGSCIMRDRIPARSSCFCVFQNGAYSNGYSR